MPRSPAIAALLLCGCVVTTSRGALLRTTPQPDRCHYDGLRGTLEEQGDALRLTVSGEQVCEHLEVAEYETERVSSPGKVLSIGAGVIAGAAVAVPGVLLISWLLEPHATSPNGNTASTSSALALLALIPAAGVGVAASAGVSAMKSREPGARRARVGRRAARAWLAERDARCRG